MVSGKEKRLLADQLTKNLSILPKSVTVYDRKRQVKVGSVFDLNIKPFKGRKIIGKIGMEFKIYITGEEQPDALAIDSLALWNPLRPDDQGNKCGAGLNGMVHELNSWMSWKLLNNTELWTPTTVCHGILAEESNLLCRPHSYHFWKALATTAISSPFFILDIVVLYELYD